MCRFAESCGQWRSSIASHINNAFDESQNKVEFGQSVVVLLLQGQSKYDESENVYWTVWKTVKARTSKRVSCVSSGAINTMGPSIGGDVPNPYAPIC